MPGTFPTLQTGAVAQYPFNRTAAIPVEAHTFLNFTRQVYRDLAAPKKTWTIALNLLDASEIATLKAFFEQQQGQYGVFTFVDPWDGTTHTTCSFSDDLFDQTQQSGETPNKTTLTVYEHV
jgi:hypothetical protein